MFGSTRIQLMIEDLSGKNLFFVSRINPHISSHFFHILTNYFFSFERFLVRMGLKEMPLKIGSFVGQRKYLFFKEADEWNHIIYLSTGTQTH